MIYDLRITRLFEVDFVPASELEEIAQNVRTIVLTALGDVPLDREFGVSTDFLDAPIGTVQAQLTAKIAQAVKSFEPRARVSDCTFNANLDGELDVNVKFKIVEDSLKN